MAAVILMAAYAGAVNPDAAETLRLLLSQTRIASLGTLHQEEPSVSMVPFAILPGSGALIVHVSQLSAHTADMVRSPRVSAMIVAPDTDDAPPQALPRVTIQADAVRLTESAEEYPQARFRYLERFPHAEGIFELRDFSLFLLRPVSGRVIGGFGRATTIGGDDLRAALSTI